MEKKLFVIVLRYLQDISVIDALRPAHVAWLDKHYAAGTFLASGRQTPGSGGVILARGEQRATIVDLVAQDPFYKEKAAEYQIFEFAPTKMAPSFKPCL